MSSGHFYHDSECPAGRNEPRWASPVCICKSEQHVNDRIAALEARCAALEKERDEARKHARDHHIEGGCLTCMAMESERDRALAEAALLAMDHTFAIEALLNVVKDTPWNRACAQNALDHLKAHSGTIIGVSAPLAAAAARVIECAKKWNNPQWSESSGLRLRNAVDALLALEGKP